MLRNLESCAGNDTLMSYSDIRRTAHTLPLLLAGADFLFSGFGSHPAYDNMFGPSQLQRRGHRRLPGRAARLGLRRRAAGRATTRSCCRCAGAPPRRAAPCTRSSGWPTFSDERRRRRACRPTAASTCRRRPPSLAAGAAQAIDERGHRRSSTSCAALARLRLRRSRPSACSSMLRARLHGDYLQTAAIFDERHARASPALTDPNDYAGPGTGYRMSAERRARGRRACGRSGRGTSCCADQARRRRLPGPCASSARRPRRAARRGRDRRSRRRSRSTSGGRSAA